VERALGIGGVFVRARDPEALRAWYERNLGIELQPYGGATFRAQEGDVTIWFLTEPNETSFGEPAQGVMVNFRVADLDAMLAQPRVAGAPVDEAVQESEHGRFGWATDPEGNRFELWQPPPGRYPEG
jgi:predicted enzyme related to lactoylglutathione lyase